MKHSTGAFRLTVGILLVLILSCVWFLQPEAIETGVIANGSTNSLSPLLNVPESRNGAETSGSTSKQLFSPPEATSRKGEDKPLSASVERALGEVIQAFEAMELANAEVFSTPEPVEGISVMVKLKAPQKGDLERMSEAVGRARRLLAEDQSDDTVFREQAQAMMSEFTDYKLPYKALRFYRVTEKNKTSFAEMSTRAEGGKFMASNGDLVFSSGSLARDRTNWSTENSRLKKMALDWGKSIEARRGLGNGWAEDRYGHLFEVTNDTVNAKASIKRAQE